MRNREKTWDRIRAKLKKEFYSRGIVSCEKCRSDYALSFAHRHSRSWYYRRDKEEEHRLLGSMDQVLLLCGACHARMDDRSLTTEEEKESIFDRIRV